MVSTGRATLAPPAPARHPTGGPNMRHQDLLVLVELDLLDDRLLDPQQGVP
jgi:hypothetical protein